MSDLTPAKHERHLHFVAFTEKFARMSRLCHEVVLFDSRTKLHFLQMDHVLLLLGLSRHLGLFELELSVVHDADHRRTS